MLIVCPNCATSYDVDAASLRPNGRRVRCARCRTVWHAELSHSDKLIAAAEALAPVRRAVDAVAQAVAEEAESDSPYDHGDAAGDTGADPEPAYAAFDAEDEAAAAAANSAAAWDEAPAVDSPPISPGDFDAAQSPIDADVENDMAADAELFENVESVAARRTPKRLGRWRPNLSLSPLQWSILALIIVDAIIIGWRADFVRLMPQTASFYAALGLPVNLRGLAFDGVTMSTEQHDGVPILVVEGSVVNETRKMVDMPHLRFAVRNAAHQEIYSWTAVPPRAVLPPGEAAAFHTRLASPPPDAHDVLIRFLNRHDIMNGAH